MIFNTFPFISTSVENESNAFLHRLKCQSGTTVAIAFPSSSPPSLPLFLNSLHSFPPNHSQSLSPPSLFPRSSPILFSPFFPLILNLLLSFPSHSPSIFSPSFLLFLHIRSFTFSLFLISLLFILPVPYRALVILQRYISIYFFKQYVHLVFHSLLCSSKMHITPLHSLLPF